jgi:hypothetical protein
MCYIIFTTNPMCDSLRRAQQGIHRESKPAKKKKKWQFLRPFFSGFQCTVFSFGNFVVHGWICGLSHGFLILVKGLGL